MVNSCLLQYNSRLFRSDEVGELHTSAGAARPSLDDVLNSMLPPKMCDENGVPYTDHDDDTYLSPPAETASALTLKQGSIRGKAHAENRLFYQFVSQQAATRVDVIKLQDKLEEQLIERGARETGICAIRESLYRDCFNELIRQVTINCTERGLLLLKVRDELQMNIQSYKTLYESACGFGVRKQLLLEDEVAGLKKQLDDFRQLNLNLSQELLRIKEKCQIIEERTEAQCKEERENFTKNLEYYRCTHQQLTKNLSELIKQAAPYSPALKKLSHAVNEKIRKQHQRHEFEEDTRRNEDQERIRIVLTGDVSPTNKSSDDAMQRH